MCACEHPHPHTNYLPKSLMNIDVKILYKILHNEFNFTLEGLYTMIKWNSFQGCKNVLKFVNQCDTPYKQKEKEKSYDNLSGCRKSFWVHLKLLQHC